ncbi:MAG: hypothetical protein JSW56_05390 [Deltaproteobacteria bacterium]|nr:MAG: hypothetical protein JSW56_05390 [Deltaproteobacteria bacterium]
MEKKKSPQESWNRQTVPEGQNIYLRQMGGLTLGENVFHRPMYMDLIEVLDLIRLVLQEKLQAEIEYFRTVESGTVEEYVITEKEGVRKNLLFRVWPVLYGHDKRLDCRIYEGGQRMSELIMYYLGLCAKTNNAKLVHKK